MSLSNDNLFPPWMRRLDPLLAAEDTNPVFDAYCKRGLVRMGGRTRLLTLLSATEALLVLWLCGQLVYTPSRASVYIAVAGMGLLYVLHRLRIALLAQSRGSILAVLHTRLGRRPDLHDLWMIGVTGRQILEAAYLETSHRKARYAFVALVVPIAVVACGIRIGAHGLPIAAAFLVACFFAYEAVREAIIPSKRELRKVASVLRKWSPGTPIPAFNNTYEEILPIYFGFLVAPFSVFSTQLASGDITITSAADGNLAAKVTIGILLLAGLALRAGKKWKYRGKPVKLRRLFAQAEVAFESYMRRVMEGSL